jgi:3-oxoacyl-[acyl-carrier-protein] synthase-3
MTSTYSRIRATGTSLSDRIVTNGVSDVRPDTVERQTTVGMAEGAARQALDDAELTPADVDFLVIGTTSPDVVFPNVGCLLQKRLGMRGCAAFSVEAGSTGFIYALSIADRFVATGQASCALVIGADTLSGSADIDDGKAHGYYAAAAGAVVLESAGEPGIVFCHLGAERHYKELRRESASPNQTDNAEDHVIGAMHAEAFDSAVESLRTVVEETLVRHSLTSDEISWMIPQQTDLTVIQATARRLGIPMQRVILSHARHGDTVTAAVPLALDLAIRDGRISDGDLLLLVALGGAITWGSALIRL